MTVDSGFLRFSAAFRSGHYDEALRLIDDLIVRRPGTAPLHWHRANCLEKLGRHGEIAAELDLLLALDPDYVPAIVKRVRHADSVVDGFDEAPDELSDVERERRESERLEQSRRRSMHAEAELRRALSLSPDEVDALHLLSDVLRYREGADAQVAEADALLDRAIALAPDRADLIEARATIRRSAAMRFDEDTGEDADIVQTYSGMRYSRGALESALEDYGRCFALTDHHRYAVRMGMVLHDLGRFAEALARYDEALARMPADDPAREAVIETRTRSENNGAGEREQMAKLLESALLGDGADRSLQDDMAAQALMGAANAIRAGKTVSEALESRLSDDPDTMLAASIAQQILNVAHEPPPGLEAVDARGYPRYQRVFIDRVSKLLAPTGLRHVADGEARGLFPMLGQHVVIRFFADASGEVGVAAFTVKPKWPGWIGFLILLLTGKWKPTSMVECVSQFDDGTHLSTQYDSPSPFEFGDGIRIERMSRRAPIPDLVARHLQRVAEHKSAHPASVAMTADDLDGMECRWREGQRVKRAYRASVGYITGAELARMLGAHHARFADKVRQQLSALATDYE